MNFRKFIVITRSRTGSNLLISLLDSHPEIWAAKELFNRLKGRSSREIWDKFFSGKPHNIQYVGFKIFYYHPLDDDDRQVWDFIHSDKTIRIIHLRRENMLRTFVSREIAAKLDQWKKDGQAGSEIPDKLVTLDIDKCLKMFSQTKKFETETHEAFASHPYHEITYESLVTNRQGEMNRIFQFLGVSLTNVETSLAKQNPENLKDLVLNYEELAKTLRASNYEHFLN